MDLLKEGDYVKIITEDNKKHYSFVYTFKNQLYVKGMPLVAVEKEFKLVKTKCKFQKHKFFLFKAITMRENFEQNRKNFALVTYAKFLEVKNEK